MVTVQLYEERPIGISLPDYVTLTITEADPVVKGQTAASSYKPAIFETASASWCRPLSVPANASSSTPTKSPTCAARTDAAGSKIDGTFSPPQRHGPGRHEGRPLAVARLRRGPEPAGLAEGAGRLCLPGRPQGRGYPVCRAVEGASRLRLPDGGARRGRRRRQPAPLDRRPARRHHQFPARHPALRHLDRAGAPGPDRRRCHLRSGDGRAVQGRERRRRLHERPPAARLRPHQAGRHGVRLPACRIWAAATTAISSSNCATSWPRSPASAASAPPRSISPRSRPAAWTASGKPACRPGTSPPACC